MNADNQNSAAVVAAFVKEVMLAGGRVQKDKGRVIYTADIHRSLAAFAMAKALGNAKFGLTADAATLKSLLAMVDNHSAWRQVMEREGIFPKKGERPMGEVDDLLAELQEEGV